MINVRQDILQLHWLLKKKQTTFLGLKVQHHKDCKYKLFCQKNNIISLVIPKWFMSTFQIILVLQGCRSIWALEYV